MTSGVHCQVSTNASVISTRCSLPVHSGCGRSNVLSNQLINPIPGSNSIIQTNAMATGVAAMGSRKRGVRTTPRPLNSSLKIRAIPMPSTVWTTRATR